MEERRHSGRRKKGRAVGEGRDKEEEEEEAVEEEEEEEEVEEW